MRYINVESDFKLLESFDCNCEVNLKDSEFTFVYYTKQYSDNKVEVSYKDGEYTNCKFTEDNRLIVLFENHKLEPGTLKVKRYFNLNDADFSDKTCDFVIEEELPISLTKGIQPCTEECCYVDVKLPPYYQKGDIGPIGPKGDKGDQGDKGDKGDLTVTGITPHNNLLDNTAFNQYDYEGTLLYWNIIGDAETEIHGGDSGIGNNALLIKSYEDPAGNTVNPSAKCLNGVGYVLSLYTKAYKDNEGSTLLINIPNLQRGKFYVDGQQGRLNNLGYISLEQSTNWEKHYIAFAVTRESPIFFAAPSTSDDGVLIAQVKLESNPINDLPDLGNIVPTPWTLSANDLKGKDIYELLVESNKFEGTREEFEDEYTDSIKAVKNATNQAIIEANNAQTISQQVQQVERDIIQRDYERSDAFDLAQSNRQQAYEDAENIRNSEYRKAESSRNSGFGSAENTRNNIFLQYESTRQNNETLRIKAEEDRKKAESDRQALFQSNEESRQNTFYTNETIRQNNESIRQTKETERETKEAERQSIFSTNEAERQRIYETNEDVREANETKRVDAEILRQEAEAIREATYKNKVDRDDNAPKLTAGFANNLVGRGDVTKEEISFRPSGGDTSIEDGTARIGRVKGSTVVWNQIYPTGWTTTQQSVTSVSLDGIISLNGTTGDTYFNLKNGVGINSTPYGHKSLYHLEIINDNSDYLQGKCFGLLNRGVYKVIEGKSASFFYVNNDETKFWSLGIFKLAVGDTITDVKIRVSIYYLTQMFGAGNEPTTIEEFNARKPLNIDEYAYNEGELISTNVEELKSVGLNAWDEEWEVGAIINGKDDPYAGHFRSKNYIPVLPNTDYFFKSTQVLFLSWYDEEYNYIPLGNLNVNNNIKKSPENAHYLRFYAYNSTTYNNDICIHIAHTGYRNGEYEPYKEFRRSIPIKDIKDKDGNQLFPNGLLSAGSAYDEITATKAIKRIGVVDMGTLTWSYSTDRKFFSTIGISSYVKYVTSQYIVTDWLLCGKGYQPSSADILYNHYSEVDKVMCIQHNTGKLWVNDASYTDASTFKAAMQGVMLYYELAEPIEVDLPEPLNLDYEVSDFGTEEVLSSEPTTPMKADIIYQFNAVDRIRDNSRHTAEAEELLKAKADKTTVEVAINELTNAIPEVVNNLTDGGADKALSAEMGKELSENINTVLLKGQGKIGVKSILYNLLLEHTYRIHLQKKWEAPSDLSDTYAYFELYYRGNNNELVILESVKKGVAELNDYYDISLPANLNNSNLYLYIRADEGEVLRFILEDITSLTEVYNSVTEVYNLANNNSSRIPLIQSVGYQIWTIEGVGNKSLLEEYKSSAWQSVVEECNEGDEYLITGKGGNSPRLWCFLDSNDIILKVSAASASATDLRITAPALAKKLVLNTRLDSDNSCYKIISIDEVVEASIDNKKELTPTSVGTQIVTAATIGNTPSFQTFSKETAQIFDIECSPNDRYVVTGKGFSNARLWAFFDSEDRVLSISEANITETQRVITAPSNAVRLIINSSVGEKSYALRKTIKIEELSAGLNGKIEELDNRIDDLNERVSLGAGAITNMLPMFQFVSLEADAANGMENWTGQEVIEKIYEPLRETYPQYIKRKSIGKSGGYDIWLYEFNNTVEEWFRLDDYVRVSNAVLPSTNGLTSKQVGIPKDVFLSSFSMDYLNLYPLSVFNVRKPTLANVELSYIGGEEYYILSCEDDIKVSDNAVDIYWTTRVKTYDQHAMIVSGTHADENAGYLGVALALKYLVEHHSDNAIMDYIYNNVKLSVVPIFNMWGANQTPKDRNAQDGSQMNRWTVGSLNAEQQILSDYVGSIKDELSYYIDCHTAEWWSNYGYVFAIPYPHAKMIPAIVSTANYLCRHWFPNEHALNWNIGKSLSGIASQSYMAETYGIDAATIEFCGQDLIAFTGCKRWDSKYMTMAVENFLNYILSITSMRIKYNSNNLIDEPLFTHGVMS